MTTPVNLNKARKARARQQAKVKADENAIRFGRSKAEKQASAQHKAKATRILDGAKRDDR